MNVSANIDGERAGLRDRVVVIPPTVHDDRHEETEHKRQRDQVNKPLTVLRHLLEQPGQSKGEYKVQTH